MKQDNLRIGIDIGRVLIGPVVGGRADTSFLGSSLEQAVRTPPAPGAFALVHDLWERTRGQVWLVSKCGPGVQAKTLAWLEHQGFHARTGMERSHVRFCRKRPDKAQHAHELGLDCFLDDRVDVLRHLRPVVGQLLLFGEQERRAPDWTTPLLDWVEVRAWFEAELGLGG